MYATYPGNIGMERLETNGTIEKNMNIIKIQYLSFSHQAYL